jgi:hypothetical protein
MLSLLIQHEWIYFTIPRNPKFVAFKATQTKKKNYHDRHPTDHFFLFIIEVFICLDKQVDVFLHDYTNAMWNFKGPKGLSLFILVTFFFPSNKASQTC